MSVRVRFAPSPTGHLHVGGARTALYNQLFARSQGGVFVLRIEDTDAERSTHASTAAIFEGMRWLGLAWDEGPDVGGAHGPYLQSERRAFYERYREALVASGHAYAAYDSPDELDAMRQAQTTQQEPQRYDGRHRSLTPVQREAFEAAGRAPVWRFRCPAVGAVAWDDVVRGRIEFQNDVLDDFVLVRSDGLPTYNFACVVDDLEMRISHVIRGDDHISNTPRQLLIYAALGEPPPVYAHASMILGPDGKRLSKRHGATSVDAFGDLGIVPEGMLNFLALLGWSLDGEHELFSLAQLEEVFRLERVGASPAVFDMEKLEWVNAQHLRRLTEDERVARVGTFLARRGYDISTRTQEWRLTFIRALGDRLKTLRDAEGYGRFALVESIELDSEAWTELLAKTDVASRLQAVAEAIASDRDFTQASLEVEIRLLATTLGVKAGELMGLARVALTGRKVSPGIFDVIWLVGRERAVARLSEAAVRWSAESPWAPQA
ncbi:MAG: glutamate--tRNA ligase [Candidatus Eisenbacteria bacterium]